MRTEENDERRCEALLTLSWACTAAWAAGTCSAIEIRTNDPDKPVKTVKWRFDVKDVER